MTRRIMKVGKQGQVTIPAEIRSTLGITQGATVCAMPEDGCVVLEVISELVDRTRGMLKGGPSLSAALKRQRQRDIQRDSKT
jgi:AbrB family looped-hinge helix DNA binding protein